MRKKKKYPGYLLYFDRVEGLFNTLDDEKLGYIMRVIYNYARYGENPCDMPKEYRLAWYSLKEMLNDDREAYLEKKALGAHAAACKSADQQGLPKPDKEMFVEEYMNTHMNDFSPDF